MDRGSKEGSDIPRMAVKVFLSYAHVDAAFGEKLTAALMEHGVEVFRTYTSLAPGQDWLSAFSEALRTSDGVVVVVSKSSVHTQWVSHEVGVVTGLFQQQGRPIAIPVVIDDIPIPAALAHIQCIMDPSQDTTKIASQVVSALSVSAGRAEARREQRRQAQARIEKNAGEFIDDSMRQLQKRGNYFQLVANIWYVIAMLMLVFGLGFGVFRFMGPPPINWEETFAATISSIIVIGLLGALARFAFVLGKSFMVEGLRNQDRMHAISFGAFYLKAFGENAEWIEIKEAFQHWNIDIGSSFLSQKATDIDPQVLSTLAEVFRASGDRKALRR